MVATVPHQRQRRRPARWAPVGQWRLYRAWGDLPRESGLRRRMLAWLLGGRQQLLYVGQTGRTAISRWAEHLDRQPFAPQIACLERDPRVYRSEKAVLAAERAAIVAERPVWNVEHNGNNPGAVRVRRRLPLHVVQARLRFGVVAVLWLVLTVLAWRLVDGVRLFQAAGVVFVLVAAGWVWLWWSRRPRRRSRW